MPSRLLSIELQGFKTFANRYKFEFPGVITCIVGPNGSGKSNVADAIRWVLGEQSYNLLRARKTEDMIFSGSSQRPRAGMASVTINFNNEDNWFPLDFSEVAITRRAYRDGQNEYFINNQKVRLKDISELLAQAGVTPRTYTIIGQGLVDAALSLRPDERRDFFEEAAGISIHRKRREEAVHRLDTTQRNLDRVKDILSELKPRVASLEKQARRVIEQERIKADLKGLMKDWYGYQWHHIQDELNRSREILRNQEVHLEQIQNQKEIVDKEIQAQQEEITRFRVDLSRWHQKSAEIHKQLDTVNRSIAVMEERARSLDEQMHFLQIDLVRMNEEEISINGLLEKEKAEANQIQSEKEENEKLLAETEKKYNSLYRQKQELSRERGILDRQNNELETEKVRIRSQILELSSQNDRFLSSKNALEKEHEELITKRDEVSKELQGIASQIEAVKSELQKAFDEQKKNLEEVSILEKELAQFSSKFRELENNHSSKTAQMEVFRSSISSNEHLSSGAKTFLKVIKGTGKSINIQSLVNVLSVNKGYEKAVAAGLGEYIDGLLLAEESDLNNVLDIIKTREIGRVIVFLNRAIPKGKESAIHKSDGVLGTARNFVELQNANPVIEALLDDILIVEDRNSALRLSGLVDKNVCVATLNGEAFRGNQAVVLGKDQRDGIFVIQQKMNDLSVEIAEVSQKTADLSTIIQEKNALLQKGNEKKKIQDAMVSELRKKQETLQLQNQKMELQSTRINEQLNSNENRLKDLEKQHTETNQKLSFAQSRLGEVVEKAKLIYQQLQEKIRQIKEISVDDTQVELNHWRTRLAVSQRSIEEFDKRLKETLQRQTGLVDQKKTVAIRIASIQNEIQAAKIKQENEETQVMVLDQDLAELAKQIQPTEEIVDGLEKKIKKQIETQTVLLQRLTTAERYVTQAQLDHSRRTDELEKLRGKIEDDFGLVNFEYQSQIIGQTPLPLNGMVDNLPMVKELPKDMEDIINRQKANLRRIGPINPEARSEYEEVKARYELLVSQLADLQGADEDLREVIRELDELMKIEFHRTFKLVANEFREMFTKLFGGGSARLILMDEEDPAESGIEIEVVMPGKRKQGLAVLSGGERSLTAVALIFSLLKVSPTPFCVLDEVDAALDEVNVGRFGDLLRELSDQTQFLVITHNRNTVQLADVIYGVTMGRDSSSQVISLMMSEVNESLVS
ncbi:MAG: chromosome segregation protein SMC [Chloroflexi bacterium]|nr:chromosome segregation protein SMC [Chloroflexota bacterium]